MKALKLIVFAMILFIASNAGAQAPVKMYPNSPPQWGPEGYSGIQFYYLPDMEIYYDVYAATFISRRMGVWVHRNNLPYRYRNYDLYSGYKVVLINYHGITPYMHFNDHQRAYKYGYKGPPQNNIGNRPLKANNHGRIQQHREMSGTPAHKNVKKAGNQGNPGNSNHRSNKPGKRAH